MSKPPVPSRQSPGAGKNAQLELPIEAQIERELRDVIQGRDVKALTERLTQIVVSEAFSGPLPHPRHLRDYDAIMPGLADRIVSMAETNLLHNITATERAQAAEIADQKRGMQYGGIIFVMLIGCAFGSLFVTDSDVAPAIFLGAAVIGGIGLFVRGRNGKSQG